MARAWRTIRGLNATERRLLVREVGFDGAEDLVEGLTGKSGGGFAPAAVLEALGKARGDEGLSVRGILTGLRDPETRKDLLARGMDLAADSYDPVDEEVDEALVMAEPVVDDIPTAQPISGVVHRKADSTRTEIDEILAVPAHEPVAPEPDPELPEIPPPPPSEIEPPPAPEVNPELEPPVPAREASPWDEPWQNAPVADPAEPPAPRRNRWFDAPRVSDQRKTTGSVLDRIRAARDAIPTLRNAGPREIRENLETLPELWARRRMLVDFIDAGIPAGVGETLDLIEDLDRPVDRRWCLAALARRGDLTGADLDRALELLSSPAARRRVAALAGG